MYRIPRQLLLLPPVGFAVVFGVIWADELLDLPHLLLGTRPSPPRLAEATLESSVVVLLALFITWLTFRLVKRLAYLESFVVLCAWCRRVNDQDEWVSFESFLASRKARTSHGLCPECADRLEEGPKEEGHGVGGPRPV